MTTEITQRFALASLLMWAVPGTEAVKLVHTHRSCPLRFLSVALNVDFNSFAGNQVPRTIQLGDSQESDAGSIEIEWPPLLTEPWKVIYRIS